MAKKFRDQKISYIELVDHYMADDCQALGFQMDCGHAFSEKYGDAGDFVLVPAGKDNHEAVVEVVKKEYFAEENVPLPMEKTKHIIRKCTDVDFDLPDDEPV